MKKSLFILTLGLSLIFNAQSIVSENFETLSVGDIGTDLAGTNAGQNGWYTSVTTGGTNAANSNFQVITSAPSNTTKVLQIAGSNAATGSRLMYKDITSAWGTRTAGNDVIQVQFKFYTGATTTSTNQTRFIIYNSDRTKVLGGLIFYQNNKAIRPILYYDATAGGGSIGNYSFYLSQDAGGNATDLLLPANTWVNVGFSFDKTSGDVTWNVPGSYSYITGAAAGIDPSFSYFFVSAGTSNALSVNHYYDDLTIQAVAAESLGVNANPNKHSQISIYPNPTTDFLFIDINAKIKSVKIFDTAGRLSNTKDVLTENKLDVRNLAKGVYILKVETENGTQTVKFIKN